MNYINASIRRFLERKKGSYSYSKHLDVKEDRSYKAVEFVEWDIVYTQGACEETAILFKLYIAGYIIF